MPTIYMVRHGKAAAGFGGHVDPGLDDTGRQQAEATANYLASALLTPIDIVSSPLARARETAAPLAARWGTQASIEQRVAEIPSPTNDLDERVEWLRKVMADQWENLPRNLHDWRRDMIDCILGYESDTVVFCHFIAVNVIVGAATEADALITFAPDNGSITRFDTEGGRIRLIELGSEANTRVN